MRWYAFLGQASRKNTSGTIRSRSCRCSSASRCSLTFMIVHGLRALFGRRGQRQLAVQAVRLGVLDLAQQPGRPHLASSRHVGARRLRHHSHLRGVREDIMSRQSIISSMISGERLFRDETRADHDRLRRCSARSSCSASAIFSGPTKALACARSRHSTARYDGRTTSPCSMAARRVSISCNFVEACDHLLVFDAIDYGLEPGTLQARARRGGAEASPARRR